MLDKLFVFMGYQRAKSFCYKIPIWVPRIRILKKGSQLAPKHICVCLQFQACCAFSGPGLFIFTFLGKDSFNCLIAYSEMWRCLLFGDVVLFKVTTSLAFVKKTEQHFVFQHFFATQRKFVSISESWGFKMHGQATEGKSIRDIWGAGRGDWFSRLFH